MDDGLWIMDMATGNAELLLTMSEIARFQPQETMQEAVHYVNHVLWNPNSSRFMFFHLWLRDGIRRSRLLTLDKNGQHLFALYNEEHVSHYCWKNNDELVAFSTHFESATSDLAIPMKSHFFSFNQFSASSGFVILPTPTTGRSTADFIFEVASN